jgi:hypothetical protein
MLNRFGQLLAEATFDVGIGSFSELLECLWEAGAKPEEVDVDTLITAITSTRVNTRPAFSPDFWSVLASPHVLDLRDETERALMLAYESEGTMAVY